jgi:hypothetical protein
MFLAACTGQVNPNAADGGPDTPEDIPQGPDAAPVTTSGVRPVAVALTPRCVAPCAVFFDATATEWDGHSDADKYLELDYQWDFGDPLSGNWSEGAAADAASATSRNGDSGFVAVHVYEPADFPDSCDGQACARFRATLSVDDGGERAQTSVDVEILSPSDQWAGVTTCVGVGSEPVAGQDGCPSGAATAQENNLNTILEEVCNVDEAASRCLLRGGDTFTAARPTLMQSSEAGIVAAFGAGKATVSASTGAVFNLDDGTDGLRLVDLDIRGALVDGGGRGAVASVGGGALTHRFLALRVDVRDFNQGFHFRGNSYPTYDPANHIHCEIAIVDSSVTQGASFGGNDVYIMGDPYAIVGSRIANKRIGDGEHTIRAKFSRRSIIAHNSLGLFSEDPALVGCDGPEQGPQGRLILKLVSGFAVTLPEDRYQEGFSREFVVADNLISACRDNAYQLSIGATDQSVQKAREHLMYYIVENNTFRAPHHERTSGTFQFARTSSSSHFVVRGNTFEMTQPATTVLGVVLDDNVEQHGQPGHLTPVDGRVLDNTFINLNGSGDDTRAAVAILDDTVEGTRIEGNVVYDETGDVDFLRGTGAETLCCDGDCMTCNSVLNEAP